MKADVLIGLIYNATLLLTLGVIYDTLSLQLKLETRLKQILTGLFIGIIGVGVMVNPWLLLPGIVFDTRSIVLSLAALFFGPLPAGIALVMTAALRIYQGGNGAITGCVVIATSVGLGLLWRRLRQGSSVGFGWLELYIFGLVVHLVMLLDMLTLPWPNALPALQRISLPVLVVYPVATVLLGKLLSQQAVRRQNADDLYLTARRLTLATESAEIGVWDLDLLNDRLTWDNQMYRMYGLRQEDFGGASEAWTESLHPEDRQSAVQAYRDAVAGRRDFHTQFRIVWSDGQVRFIEAHAVVLRAPDGAPQRMIGVNRDMTQRRQLEAQVLQAQKMEAVGRLAGGIAHDFNNLLVPIIGYAELGMMKLPAGHELVVDLERIKSAAERAASLTHQILAFSRQQVLEMEILDLNRLIGEYTNMLQRLIGEDIELRNQLSPELAPLKGDKSQLGQVLVNLAVNARDAMPAGGVLTVETANVRLDAEYAARRPEVIPGSYVLLTVTDTGVGMDAVTCERIFEPFFTTKDAGHGTGLGLATVLGIIQQHQGSIEVDSQPGQGTTFKIYLPAAAAAPLPEVEQPAPSSSALHGSETLLVVEDNTNVRQLVNDTLQRYGYQVLVAPDPRVAMELAESHAGRIHLLISDVVMPYMKGTELHRRLALTRPDLMVIYMSGYTDDVIIHHGALKTGQAFIQKPFSIRHLLEKVRGILDEESARLSSGQAATES